MAVDINAMFDHALRKLGLSLKVNTEIKESYDIRIEGTPTLNMITNTLEGGTIKLVKTKDHFEEKDLLKLMGREGLVKLATLDTRRVNVEHCNEILELLGDCEMLLKSKSIAAKCQGIHSKLELIMDSNKWNIRSIELSNKIGEWIYLYLQHGNMAALVNFCKLKVMTHNGDPIYSVQEEPV